MSDRLTADRSDELFVGTFPRGRRNTDRQSGALRHVLTYPTRNPSIRLAMTYPRTLLAHHRVVWAGSAVPPRALAPALSRPRSRGEPDRCSRCSALDKVPKCALKDAPSRCRGAPGPPSRGYVGLVTGACLRAVGHSVVERIKNTFGDDKQQARLSAQCVLCNHD